MELSRALSKVSEAPAFCKLVITSSTMTLVLIICGSYSMAVVSSTRGSQVVDFTVFRKGRKLLFRLVRVKAAGIPILHDL